MAMPRIFRNRWFWVVTALVLAVGGYVGFRLWDRYWPHTYTVTISKETTVLTGPVTPDGLIDYDAVMDAELSKGVTPENNAAVLLVRTLHPEERAKLPREVLTKLGMAENDPPPADADASYYELLHQASRREKFYLPRFDHGYVMVEHGRNIVIQLNFRATKAAQEGRIQQAIEDLLAAQRLTRLCNFHHMPFFGPGMEDRVLKASADIVAAHEIGPNARAWLEGLDSLPPMPPVIDQGMLFAQYSALRDMSRIARYGMGDIVEKWGMPKSYARHLRRDWDADLRSYNARVKRINELAAMPDRTKAQAEFSAIGKELDTLMDSYQPGWLGQRLKIVGADPQWEMLMEHPGDFMLLIYRSHTLSRYRFRTSVLARLELLRTALALDLYHSENGRWPKKLEELTPKYLKSLPRDPYSESDLIYKPAAAGYLLYSVGSNGKDDGGVNGMGDDIAIPHVPQRLQAENADSNNGPPAPEPPGGE